MILFYSLYPSLSANKGVNQQVMRFAPFYTPENLIATKTTPKTKNFTIWMWRADYHCSFLVAFVLALEVFSPFYRSRFRVVPFLFGGRW